MENEIVKESERSFLLKAEIQILDDIPDHCMTL